MRRNLDTAVLRSFVTVAETGSMTATANVLNLTQGAVSLQIKKLEEALACSLFERQPGGLRLSPAGERLLGKARRLLALNDEIWTEMTNDPIRGRVRLGVPHDLGGSHMAPVLKAFAASCPQVDMALLCDSSPRLSEMLAAGALDIALIEELQGPTAGEPLFVDRLVWVGCRGGDVHARRPLPVSMVSDSCAFRPSVLSALQARGIEWRTVFENGVMEATAATVRADLAVTAWLVSTVPGDLVVLGPDSGLPDLPTFSINLHLPERSAALPVAELARHIRRALLHREPQRREAAMPIVQGAA